MPAVAAVAGRRLSTALPGWLVGSARVLSVRPDGAWRQATHEVKAWNERVQGELLTPLNSRLLGPLERREFPEAVPLPFVLLLGNHSSGKSSFINYVLGRNVQQTGVAPTDDGFTVIAPAERDADRDGASFVGDPSMGFSPLRAFGPGFLSHFKLKLRHGLHTKDLMLVDSPGMIDSPDGQLNLIGRQTNADSLEPPVRYGERGYDFLGVTRWLAEQADVVLLFFDPDKPGTTGETLGCLTHSLSGLEHKTHIVLNKVDTFSHIHDFARAYGALCWNLSKVIPRKDLPRIYTMFLPPHAIGGERAHGVAGGQGGLSPSPAHTNGSRSSPLALALAELDGTREELIDQVHCAPERRVDNLITRTHDSTAVLRMHALMMEYLRSAYAAARLHRYGAAAALAVLSPISGCAAVLSDWATFAEGGAIAGGVAALAAAAAAHGTVALSVLRNDLLSEKGLEEAFRVSHAHVPRDEYTLALWRTVKPRVAAAAEQLGLQALPKLSADEIAQLNAVIDEQVPALRRRAGSARATDSPLPAWPDPRSSGSVGVQTSQGPAIAAAQHSSTTP